MKKITILAVISAVTTLLWIGCAKNEPNPNAIQKHEKPQLPETAYNYASQVLPTHLQMGMGVLGGDVITDAKASLGRVLFYDTKLSVNNLVSCASCHKQQNAFADPIKFSKGFSFNDTKRNASSIINLNHSTHSRFFWDLRSDNLMQQVMMPVNDHIEMGIEHLDYLPGKLAKTDYYPALFESAFGTAEVTRERIAGAMAQFLCSVVSYRSKWDVGQSNGFANYSPVELSGKQLFDEIGCQSCHSGPNLEGWGASNIGLDLVYTDNGVGGWDNASIGSFKIPSLRNLGMTGPYMHDGRFNTLEEVIEHYANGVKNHPNLDPIMNGTGFNGGGNPIDPPFGGWGLNRTRLQNLTATEKQNLIAFLNTLNDYELTKDIKYSDPFKY